MFCAPDLFIFNLLNRKQIVAIIKFRSYSLIFMVARLCPCCPVQGSTLLPSRMGDSLSSRWSLDAAASPSPLCALLWRGVKVLLQKPLAFISVSSCSRHFPRAAGVQLHCPVLVPWNNRLCFLLTRVLLNNGQIVLNHILFAEFSIAQYVNPAVEKNHVFKMSKSPNLPFSAHS